MEYYNDHGTAQASSLPHNTTEIKRTRCIRAVLVIMCISGIAAAIASLYLNIVHNMAKAKDSTPKPFRYCVNLADVPSTAVERLLTTYDQELDTGNGGVAVCTAEPSEAVKLDQLKAQKEDSMADDALKSKQEAALSVSAHRCFESGKKFLRQNNILTFRSELKYPIEHERNVASTNDSLGLEVKYTGLYYAYKSVFFKPNTESICKQADQRKFYSALRKVTPYRGHQDLLTSVHNCCPNCEENKFRETSFSGGIFSLVEHDVIEVLVNFDPIEHVNFNSDVTFMGLMMLPEA